MTYEGWNQHEVFLNEGQELQELCEISEHLMIFGEFIDSEGKIRVSKSAAMKTKMTIKRI